MTGLCRAHRGGGESRRSAPCFNSPLSEVPRAPITPGEKGKGKEGIIQALASPAAMPALTLIPSPFCSAREGKKEGRERKSRPSIRLTLLTRISLGLLSGLIAGRRKKGGTPGYAVICRTFVAEGPCASTTGERAVYLYQVPEMPKRKRKGSPGLFSVVGLALLLI